MPIAWHNLYPPSDPEKHAIQSMFNGGTPVSIANGSAHWLTLWDAANAAGAAAQPVIFSGTHGGAYGDAPHLSAMHLGNSYHLYCQPARWRRGGNGEWVNGQRITVTMQ